MLFQDVMQDVYASHDLCWVHSLFSSYYTAVHNYLVGL